MKFAVYSEVGEGSIRDNLGRSEYSYYFVLKSFLPALERLGAVVRVANPATELDAVFADCAAADEDCLFISFSPPHKAFIDHDHPMLVVFAWEFATIPDEPWLGEPRNDWRTVFARNGRAISLSSHTAAVVRKAMGADFPILAAAAPVWDRFAALRARPKLRAAVEPTELRLEGLVLDSRTMDLSPDYLLKPEPPLPEPPLPEPPLPEPPAPEPAAAPPAVELAVAAEPEPEPAPPAVEEPPPVVAVAEEPIVAVPPPATEPVAAPARKTLRHRLGITKHHALEWYREALRDLFPRWLAWIVSRIGRAAYRSYRLLFGRRPAPVVEAPVVEAPVTVEPAEIVVVEIFDEPSPPEPETMYAFSEPTPVAPPPPRWPEARVTVDGVVYTSVLNPTDGRKNYKDLITAFCWAFRDVEDATLVLKMVQGDLARWYHPYVQMLSQLAPFKCRVVALHGYLEDDEYRKMIEATTYYVNASCCEGLCLPLMEFMSCRRPAVAPDHTAMADYIDASNAFIVRGTLEHNVWPHDPRDLFRTERYRIDWGSLLQAYEDSYRVAKGDPNRYRAMGGSACDAMCAHNSDDAVVERLRGFLAASDVADRAAAAARAEREDRALARESRKAAAQ